MVYAALSVWMRFLRSFLIEKLIIWSTSSVYYLKSILRENTKKIAPEKNVDDASDERHLLTID